MWAIAGMAAAPAVMAIGVAYFISRTCGPAASINSATPSKAEK
jgi:hypothetical protein